MRIEDHTSGCVANMAVLAGILWFLGKSRSNPLCMGKWVGRGPHEWVCSPYGGYSEKTLVSWKIEV